VFSQHSEEKMKKLLLITMILVIAASFAFAAIHAPAVGTPQIPAASGVTVPPAYADLLRTAPPLFSPLRVGWNT
jgi:F0F1-type ATP synthase assembly protein I